MLLNQISDGSKKGHSASATALVDPRWTNLLNSFGYLSRELSDAGFSALKRRVVPTLSQMLATALAEDMSTERSTEEGVRVPFVTLVAKRKV